MMQYLLFGLFLSALYTAEAQTINAASCSQTDVQTAFNQVTISTTTINLPSCTKTGWTGAVTLTIPSGNTNAVSLLGAGNLATTGGGDATIIADNDTADANPILVVNDNAINGTFRIAGITFEDGTSSNTKWNGVIGINATSPNIRADHNHFNTATSGSSMMQWQGCAYGVVDHSIFDGSGTTNAVRAYNSGSCNGDALGVGDQSWTLATALGSANFLFMENNVFNGGASDDCTKGGRFVSRFNTFNSTSPAPTIQTHPTGGGERERGCRAWEVYQNSINAVSANYINAGFWISSGTGVIWGNTIPSSSAGGGTGYHNFIELLSMRRNNSTYPQSPTPTGWGYCGTSFDGTGSKWDQNTSTTSGHHCLDQPGMGVSQLLINDFPNTLNNSTGTIAWPNQAVEPIYEWMDNYSLVPNNPSVLMANNDTTALTQNADYYDWCNASSQSGCTSFNGTAGVGNGTLAARPSTCTTGVAYWATDQGSWNKSGNGGQGELFKCTATNTWTLFYTPYTYPHPLINTQQAPAPAAPVNLRVSAT